ncbi:MAG: hypothetical protein H2212_03650 [Ruminococcus sp.]|nr:hypothetical protein [Ruminococcus sp.]
MEDKIKELRGYAQFDLYTVNEVYALQLFDQDICPNDIAISCIWEDSSSDVIDLLDMAIEWCKYRVTIANQRRGMSNDMVLNYSILSKNEVITDPKNDSFPENINACMDLSAVLSVGDLVLWGIHRNPEWRVVVVKEAHDYSNNNVYKVYNMMAIQHADGCDNAEWFESLESLTQFYKPYITKYKPFNSML